MVWGGRVRWWRVGCRRRRCWVHLLGLEGSSVGGGGDLVPGSVVLWVIRMRCWGWVSCGGVVSARVEDLRGK